MKTLTKTTLTLHPDTVIGFEYAKRVYTQFLNELPPIEKLTREELDSLCTKQLVGNGLCWLLGGADLLTSNARLDIQRIGNSYNLYGRPGYFGNVYFFGRRPLNEKNTYQVIEAIKMRHLLVSELLKFNKLH